MTAPPGKGTGPAFQPAGPALNVKLGNQTQGINGAGVGDVNFFSMLTLGQRSAAAGVSVLML
jgi:hypothetical protein